LFMAIALLFVFSDGSFLSYFKAMAFFFLFIF
jgi:hypothetical protein